MTDPAPTEERLPSADDCERKALRKINASDRHASVEAAMVLLAQAQVYATLALSRRIAETYDATGTPTIHIGEERW